MRDLIEEDLFVRAPRIPRLSRQDTPDGEWKPAGPHVDMVILLALTGGTIAWLWGAWALVCWVVRLVHL